MTNGGVIDRETSLASEYIDAILLRAQEVLKDNVISEWKSDTGYTTASGKMNFEDNDGTGAQFLYPFQWLWDTFFISGWSSDIDQAVIDVRKFIASQHPNGFLGHIRYNREALEKNVYFPPANIYFPHGAIPPIGEITSRITQPPNIAYGVWELAQKLGRREKHDFLEEIFPSIFGYYKYLYDFRVYNGRLRTIHPWEGAADNSPIFDMIYKNFGDTQAVSEVIHEWKSKTHGREFIPSDEASVDFEIYLIVLDWLHHDIKIPYDRLDTKLIHPSQRPTDNDYDKYLFLIYLYGKWGWDEETILKKSPYLVEDPMSNAILLRSDQALYAMAGELEREDQLQTIRRWIRQTQSGLEDMWDEKIGTYGAIDCNKNIPISVATSSCFVPVFSHMISPMRVQRMVETLENISVLYPDCCLVPSTLPSEVETFDPKKYWRGPVWPIINELIAEGLTFYGYEALANRIRNDSLKLIHKSMQISKGDFYEYYHPYTGEGLGSPFQSWTAAAILKTLSEREKYITSGNL